MAPVEGKRGRHHSVPPFAYTGDTLACHASRERATEVLTGSLGLCYPAGLMLPQHLVKATLQWQEYFQHEENLKTALGRSLLGFFYALTLMADKKQQDYGSKNLTDFGPRGVLMRMYDKANRVRNLYFRDGREHTPAVEEHVLETWGDWMIYEAIGWLMEAQLWPEGKGCLPNEPILEQPVLVTAPVSEEEKLIEASRRVCAKLLHFNSLPAIGHHYSHPRHPGTVVECAAVMPDFHNHAIMGVVVVFRYIAEPTTQLEPCYCAAPLEWFMNRFPHDEHETDTD